MNGTVGLVSVNTPNLNPKKGFSSVMFGFEPQFRTEPSHHYPGMMMVVLKTQVYLWWVHDKAKG